MSELALSVTTGVVASVGLYLAMSRDLMRIVVGLAMLGSAVNLFVFAAGRLGHGAPPLVAAGAETVVHPVANPLPQALVLTAIVIGFALACFSVALVLSLQRRTGEADADALQFAEPPAKPDGDPGVLP
jgi:multicomponent Na+:H+ antiporter subunit C